MFLLWGRYVLDCGRTVLSYNAQCVDDLNKAEQQALYTTYADNDLFPYQTPPDNASFTILVSPACCLEKDWVLPHVPGWTRILFFFDGVS